MKVLYDYQTFFQRVGGVSRCFCELVKHMPANVTCKIAVSESDNVYLRDEHLMPNLPYCRLNTEKFLHPIKFKGRIKLYNFLEKHFQSFPTFNNINKPYSIDCIKQNDFDILHPTLYDDYFIPYLKGKPFVVTVHDMIWELRPSNGNRLWSKNKHELCLKANHIIAISEHTKKDLINLWNIPEEKITVIYHGYPATRFSYGKRIIKQPYFLFVGRRESYKNFNQTLKDFTRFHTLHPETMLVCTGRALTKQEKELAVSLHIEKSVRTMFVTDEELANLYHYAIAFIFPSTYEGFGMPILESFAYGGLTLLNNSSCFPEIGGDAAIYFNSNEQGESDLLDRLVQVYEMDENERSSYIQKGYERIKLFSWEKASNKLADIYSQLI